jgi:prophage maintenance system killer protein
MTENKGEVIIYQAEDGTVQAEVRMTEDSLWLSEQQIAVVFERDRTVIGRHIKNIIKTGELNEQSNVQKMHSAHSDKPVVFYNLDMILSVGYRVNSKRGTQFRIWANRILKEHLVQGYTINEKRLKEQQNKMLQLRESIQMVERSLLEHAETIDDARNIVKVLAEFAGGLQILDDYDHENLAFGGNTQKKAILLGVQDFLAIVDAMRRDFDSAVFGQTKDNSFNSSVGQIYQSFDGNDLYPSIEHKAAMLLYLVVKNHSFVDGNKRIAAALFLFFLETNGLLHNQTGHRIVSDDGLAALTLLIAISKPEEKDTMVKIVITVLNRSNVITSR